MANEIEEVRYQVGEAWKGEYNAATPYGVAAVVQDPTGLSVYRSLKNGNTGHPLTDTNWWFCIIDMSSIKAASDDVDALNTEVSEDEAERVSAENDRVTAENNRDTAESGRVTSENGRVSAENGRVTAESARVSSESARASAESSRATAESARVSAENARVLAENLRDNAESSRATAETNRAAAESERHTQYTADHNAAVSDHTTAQLDHTTAVADHEQATADHTASVAATAEASNVNAGIDGLVVTITDRNGQSHSVNIGFDIAGTYASVAAMNADAANVQEGAFVMIATSDPTSTENARLYVRNSTAPTSSEPFTFLSDLDQAATSAWADWMENYKPTIIADHQRAETDHTTASTDHTTAASDHTAATTDHTQAASDHNTAASDHTAAASDHTRAESDHTTAAADHTQAESDHSRAETDHSTMEPRIANLEENKANKDGYYSQMTVGAAETLVGETVDSADYLIRPTGGESNEVANAVASVLGMEGNSAVWNQLVKNGDFSDGTNNWSSDGITTVITNNELICTATASTFRINQQISVIQGHKYMVRYTAQLKSAAGSAVRGIYITDQNNLINNGSVENIGELRDNLSPVILKKIVTATGTGNTYVRFTYGYDSFLVGDIVGFKDYIFIDLTLLGIDNLTTVAEVEAWLAQHVGTKPYYAYNAGTILSAQTLGIKTYGQNLLNPTTRQAKLIPYEWEENSNVYTIKNVPSGATATFTPDATGVAESITITNNEFDITSYGSGILELSAATADTYVCMKWDEQKDDDVVPFEEHTQTFDVRKVYGKVNGAGEYVQCYPNGLRGIGNIKDTLTAAEAVVKIGSVDMGDLEWTYVGGDIKKFYSEQLSYVKDISNSTIGNLICGIYTTATNDGLANRDKSIATANTRIYVKDLSYTDATTFTSAVSGIKIFIELATPITYTDLVYRDGGIDRPLSDVLFNIDVDNWSIEEQLLTPYDENGNPTAVPAKISTQYGMDAVEEIDTIKHTYVSAYSEQNFSDSQKAQARHNIGAGTVNPTDNCPQLTAGTAKNLIDTHGVGSEQEFVFRETGGGTAISGNGNVTIQKFKGNTLTWQQYAPLFSITSGDVYWAIENCTTEVADDGKQVNVTFTSATNLRFRLYNAFTTHKYYFKWQSKIDANCPTTWVAASFPAIISADDTVGAWSQKSQIITGSVQGYGVTYPNGAVEGATFSIRNLMCIDLTNLFGAGNEPSTVAEFEALYPLDYYAYTATPVLINNEVKQIETTGRNQWDEEWESGYINLSTGENAPSPATFRSKGYIPIMSGQTYYVKQSYGSMYFLCYDANKNYLGSTVKYGSGVISGLKDRTSYIRFYFEPNASTTTYKNDICINLSDASFNGTYEAYHKNTIDINLDNFQVKDGENNVITVNGLKSAGSVYDEIDPVRKKYIKRIGVVDLGRLTWNTNWYAAEGRMYTTITSKAAGAENIIYPLGITVVNNNVLKNTVGICGNAVNNTIYIGQGATHTDSDAFIASLSGVYAYYELATPVEYDLVTTIPDVYATPAGGTEGIVPQGVNASGVPKTAPFRGTNLYSKDYVQTINDMPVDYDTTASIDALTTALATTLGTALNGTITITRGNYDETNKKYGWTVNFTANT